MIRIKSKDLTLSDLRRTAVWTWSTDLMQSEDALVPVEMTPEGLADPDSYLIYAKFRTADGSSHEGLVVYDPDDGEVFAIELFLGNSRVTLNKYVPDLSNIALEQYEKLTGKNASKILPISYQIMSSDLCIAPGKFTFAN